MRTAFTLAATVVVLTMSAAAATAQTAGAIGPFGGLPVDADGLSDANVGGAVTFAATPHVQVIGEVGRLGNVLPSVSDTLFDWSGVGLRASALYGEGGVRLVALPHARVTPYGEASAGIARLSLSTSGLGSVGNTLASLALEFVDRTGPIAGVGGGVLFTAGPVQFDVGYRYKQVFAPEPLTIALGLGQELRSNQVRVGVGVRF